jgi:hypothetical protein
LQIERNYGLLDEKDTFDFEYRLISRPNTKTDYDKHEVNDRQLSCTIYVGSTLGMLMKDASYFLKLARRCRDFGKTSIEPEVVEQLRIWATELAGMAEDSESRTVEPEMAD